jgi:hypothetical protein
MDFPSRKKPDGGTLVDSRDGEEVVFGNYRTLIEGRQTQAVRSGNRSDKRARKGITSVFASSLNVSSPG